MPARLRTPITYLITGGGATSDAAGLSRVLALVGRAAAAGVSLVQLREKHLSARALYELASRAAAVTRGGDTLLLVNDRADIARAAGCDGVHLTTQSLEARAVRRAFGEGFLVGVSAHTLREARAARDGGADFATFGPVFDTPSKRVYGPPVGLDAFREAAHALAPFPLVALGGVGLGNARDVFRAGACGVAAIRMFGELPDIAGVIQNIEAIWSGEGEGAERG